MSGAVDPRQADHGRLTRACGETARRRPYIAGICKKDVPMKRLRTGLLALTAVATLASTTRIASPRQNANVPRRLAVA